MEEKEVSGDATGTAAEGESKIRNIATGWIKTSGVNIENMGLSRRA